MKKNSKSRNIKEDLYFAFDKFIGYESFEEEVKAKDLAEKFGITKTYSEDTRNYGLFYYGKIKKVKIDPIRFNKKIGLTKKQRKVISKRKTHYFYPSKKEYLDYNCNIFKKELAEIKSLWLNDFKPMIFFIEEFYKRKNSLPSDDFRYTSGVFTYEEATINTNIENHILNAILSIDKEKVLSNFYAQFFHLMASRIEAVFIKVLTKNGYEGNRFDRNILYAFKGNREGNVKELENFNYYDQLYCIWNFIKHNSLSTFETINSRYPNLVKNTNYQQGDLALDYIKIDNELILKLLSEVEIFFNNYCELVFDEKIEESVWNYEKYFIDKVEKQIEEDNPKMFDTYI